MKEDSDDFVPTAYLHTEISLLEKTVKSSPVCGFASSCSLCSLASALFVDGKVSDEFTFMDTSEVSVIVSSSKISASVDSADVSLLGESRTSSGLMQTCRCSASLELHLDVFSQILQNL